MPRKLRVVPVDQLFHVTARGVDGLEIFRSVTDRVDFLDLLARVVDCHRLRCHAYCLMGSHFHLVVRTPDPTLSEGMQLLNGAYAQRFNKRYGRRGHLFGGRFASVMIESDGHLLETYRYVALNPVRAGLCAAPEGWRWSSFRATVGLERLPAFLDVDELLGLFRPRRDEAQRAFAKFVEEGEPGPRTAAA